MTASTPSEHPGLSSRAGANPVALGIAVIALARKGIRTGQRWALWTAFWAPVIGVGLALPLHYRYGFATMGHLGLIYAEAAILLSGTLVATRELSR